MKAEHIARLIDLAACAVIDGSASIEEGSELNRELWDLARSEGCAEDVDAILQGASLAEMKVASQCKVQS